MTVRELIIALMAFPSEMEVMVDGPEGGISPIEPPEKIKIKRNYWEDMDVWDHGPHERTIFPGDPYDEEVVHINDAS